MWRPAGYTPVMPLASWLFVKEGRSIWVERPSGYSMIVAGPGPAREEHEFPDEDALQAFQVDLGERLVDQGWFLWGYDRERRTSGDRRADGRNTPDRRQTLTLTR